MYYCCAITDRGIRDHNEDALLIHKTILTEGVTEQLVKAPFLTAVADGVAGEQSGEIASSMCLKMLKNTAFTSRTDLKKVLLQIHESLAEQGRRQSNMFNMQTTLCGFGIDEQHYLHTMNVGDSRLYRYRNGCIKQLSRDQSLVQMLFEEGSITKEEKRTHAHRNIIFPVLGNLSSLPSFDVQAKEEYIEFGDILLLCSDGLSDYLSSHEIEEILALPKPLVRRLRLLADQALQNGGSDNISIIAVTRTAG